MKAVSGAAWTVIFWAMLLVLVGAGRVEAGGAVTIREDGLIFPATAPISTNDLVTYTLTDDIAYGKIIVERDGITIDGAGHTLRGSKPLGSGIVLSIGRKNVVIRNMVIRSCPWGVELVGCSNIIITGNTLMENEVGVRISSSDSNTISGNIMSNNDYGIDISSSGGSLVSGNNITDCVSRVGILLGDSRNDRVENNVLTNCGLQTGRDTVHLTVHNNLVNGKPLVYLEGASDRKVDDAGQVILVRSNGIVVEDLSIHNIRIGVTLLETHACTIRGNNLSDNMFGVRLLASSNNRIFGNIMNRNYDSVVLDGFLDMQWVWHGSSNNVLYHNNLEGGVSISQGSANAWDNGYPSGGNYWPGHARNDARSGPSQDMPGGDGIADTSHVADEHNIDRFPLNAPFSTLDASWEGKDYAVDVNSNSTITDFFFNPEEGAFIRFNVTGRAGSTGFCRVGVPREFLWTEDGWTVLVNGEAREYSVVQDGDYTYLYFTYRLSTKTVTIRGTHVVPESPSAVILSLFMIAALLPRDRLCHRTHTWVSLQGKGQKDGRDRPPVAEDLCWEGRR